MPRKNAREYTGRITVDLGPDCVSLLRRLSVGETDERGEPARPSSTLRRLIRAEAARRAEIRAFHGGEFDTERSERGSREVPQRTAYLRCYTVVDLWSLQPTGALD